MFAMAERRRMEQREKAEKFARKVLLREHKRAQRFVRCDILKEFPGVEIINSVDEEERNYVMESHKKCF